MSRLSTPPLNRRNNGPGRPKDLGKRAAILDAARALFVEQGFGGVSMDGIAAQAGVSKLTVYSHFGDKETLFTEAISLQCQQMMPEVLFRDEPCGGVREQLLEIGHAFFTMICSDTAISTHRMMLTPGCGDARLRQMFWEAGPQRMHRVLAELLGKRMERGELRIDDLQLAASQFFCLLKGELHSLMMCGIRGLPSTAEVDAHIAASIDFFLRAYGPQTPIAPRNR